MKTLTPNKYTELKGKISDLDQRVEKARPKDRYMVVYKNKGGYYARQYQIEKFMTLQEAELYRDFKIGYGPLDVWEIYITEIIGPE